MQISVGQVSGLIATGVFILQFTIPLALPLLLAGYIAEKNSLVTWSVLGRFLHASWWPSVLRTDTAASHGVSKRVSFVGLFQTAALILVTVASIVTPLGLYDVVKPSGNRQLETFKYLPDPSPFGLGTPSRSTAPFTRACGNEACPGATKNSTCTQLAPGGAEVCNGTVIDRRVPEVLRTLFRDGATSFSAPVSSIFDIQWRTHYNASDSFSSLRYYLRSAYRQITTLILEPGLHVVEGLVVDSKAGGIGFRNHTVPSKAHEYGSSWTEDILFVEPETACVSLNFTFNFHLEEKGSNARPAAAGLHLKDHGGFSNLSRHMPVPNMQLPLHQNGQGELRLKDRAYNAAWLNNYLTLTYFNLTNPDIKNITRIDVEPGMEIGETTNETLKDSNSTFYIEYQSIRSSAFYGEYLVFNDSLPGNPHNVTSQDFTNIAAQCIGSINDNPANINSSLVGCGLLYGAARRTDGGDRLIPDPGSEWEVPVYSCASSVQATIRSVDFQYNGTTLAGLNVVKTKPKEYASASEFPLWGVENMHDFAILNAQPLWGILGPSNTTLDKALETNVSTVSQQSLRLPGIMDDLSLISDIGLALYETGQNVPAVNFYTLAMRQAFTIKRPDEVAYGDYSGQTQLALYALWQNLSSTATDASKILDLVWTDIAANSVVGTKGWGLTSVAAGGKPGVSQHEVVVYGKYVRFHMPFAVPAFVILGVAAAVLVTLVALLVTRKTGFVQLRHLIDATSPGRIIGSYEWPEEPRDLKANEWVKRMGIRSVPVNAKTKIEPAEELSVEDGQISQLEQAAIPVSVPVKTGSESTELPSAEDEQIPKQETVVVTPAK